MTRRKRGIQTIAAALENTIPILPLYEIIFDYSEGFAIVSTLLDADGKEKPEIEQSSAIIMRPNKSDFWLADYYNQIWNIQPTDDGLQIRTIKEDVAHEKATFVLQPRPLRWPRALCAHPTLENNFFTGYDCTLARNDGTKVVPMTGLDPGHRNGFGMSARFHAISGCVCTSNGLVLYIVDDVEARIRAMTLADTNVTTIAGDGQQEDRDGHGTEASLFFPDKLTFYHSSAVKPDSILFVTTRNAIRRFDVETGELTTFQPSGRFAPSGIACTANGTLDIWLPKNLQFIQCRSNKW